MHVPLLLFLFEINETVMFGTKLCLVSVQLLLSGYPTIPRLWNLALR